MIFGCLFVIAALVVSAPAFAAEPIASPDRLAPVQNQPGVLADYEQTVLKVLREAFAPGVKVRVFAYPSFRAEYALGLRQSADGGDEIFAVAPTRKLWDYTAIKLLESGVMGVFSIDGRSESEAQVARLRNGLPASPEGVALKRCAAPLDAATASRVQAAWLTLLQEVRPAEELMGGADGESYRFSMETGDRILTGETWSPEKGTRPAKLVKLVAAMLRYCERKSPRDLREIARRSTELTTRR